MYGRNGVDQLSLAIVVGSLVLDLVSMFVAPHHLWLGECAVPGVHRRLGLRPVPHLLPESHQAPERKPAVGELDVADEKQPPEAKARHADKAHKYFTCKNCKTICRVPVGKGKNRHHLPQVRRPDSCQDVRGGGDG